MQIRRVRREEAFRTGGLVVILNGVGRNFAAAMSGGIAYVYDR